MTFAGFNSDKEVRGRLQAALYWSRKANREARRNVLPVDPYLQYVKSIVHAEGANGGTALTDEIAGVVWTRNGTPTLSTEQKKFGNTSIKSSPSTFHSFSTTNAGIITVGSGSLCFETYLRYKTLPSSFGQAFGMAGGNGFSVGHFFGNISLENAGNARIVGPATVINTWYHIAIAKNGNVFTLFVDGQPVGTWTSALSFTGTSFQLTGNLGSSNYTDCFVDEFRATIGHHRYAGAFTPPPIPF